MSENRFYLCEDTNEILDEYDSLDLLLEEEEYYLKNNDNWFIIEGKIIRKGCEKYVV